MARRAAALPIVALAVSLSACGGSSAPGGGTTTGSSALPANASGRQVFTSVGCAGCHTLAAVHATGSIGPDLDQLKPSYAAVVSQVTHGGGGMPSFAKRLSKAQIKAVSQFVATVTGGGD